MIRRKVVRKPQLELLEDRTVPATLVNPQLVTFQDQDGDLAQIVFSKPVLNPSLIESIVQFEGGFSAGNNSLKQQLDAINVSGLDAASALGLHVTVKVTKKSLGGDGQVHVRNIISSGQSLGDIRISGDLGQFSLNSPLDQFQAAKSLQVHTLGRFGPYGGSTYLESALTGRMELLKVSGDSAGSIFVYAQAGDNQTIRQLQIGGSLRGHLRTFDSGINQISIKGNLDGSETIPSYVNPIDAPGSLIISGQVSSISLGGSILGGSITSSGNLSVLYQGDGFAVNQLQIGKDVVGNGESSGRISISGSTGQFTLKGSILGGDGLNSGRVQLATTNVLLLEKNIMGGAGNNSGVLQVDSFEGFLSLSVTIRGMVQGGSGDNSGSVLFHGQLNKAQIGQIRGGTGIFSGRVAFQEGLPALSVGSITGGEGDYSGSLSSGIFAQQVLINPVITVNGTISGGLGNQSGKIEIMGAGARFTLKGNLIGGTGTTSGFVHLYQSTDGETVAGTMSILGSIRGGTGTSSGTVVNSMTNTAVVLNGSVEGGAGYGSGQLNLDGYTDAITVKGHIVGGTGEYSGKLDKGGIGISSKPQLLQILGNVIGGSGANSGQVIQRTPLDRFSLGGSILGGAGSSAGLVDLMQGSKHSSLTSITGGDGVTSGSLYVSSLNAQAIQKQQVSIKGSVRGGSQYYSGSVQIQGNGTQLRISGSVQGGTGERSATVKLLPANDPSSEKSSIWIGGAVIGQAPFSGYINSEVPLSQLTITGNLLGGSGHFSGYVHLENELTLGLMGKSILGGAGENSGSIASFNFPIQELRITGNIQGSTGNYSGVAYASSIESATIAGSVIGGSGSSAGGVQAGQRLGTIKILKDLTSGAYVSVTGSQGDRILQSLQIGGSIISSTVFSQGIIGSVLVKRSITGTENARSWVYAYGRELEDGIPFGTHTIGSITVGMDVQHAGLLAGFFYYLPDQVASLGSITVSRNWIDSAIVAGYHPGSDNELGTDDDTRIDPNRASFIDQVFIKGKILGQASSGMVIQAGEIKSVRVGTATIPLQSGAYNDDVVLSALLRIWEP